MATDKQFFKGLMAQQQLSLRAVAARMGLGHSQLSLTFSDKRRMQISEAAQLAQIFGVPLSRIAEAAGIELGRDARVPVVGCMRGNGTVLLFNKKEFVPAPDGLPEDAIAIQAHTDGSPNAWLDGWTFYCQPPTDVASDALGRFCYVQLSDGRLAMATVRRGYQPSTFNLSGPFTVDSVALDWATPVLVARS